MRTTFVSTYSMNAASRLSLLKSQAELAKASTEAVTGRHADIGVALGYKTGQAVSLRQDFVRLKSISASNDLASFRLDVTQTTLTAAINEGNKFRNSMLTYAVQPEQAGMAVQEGIAALQAFIDKVNTNNDGAYIFAGINSDVQPVGDYYAAGAASRTAVQTAFSAIGTPAADITPAQMQAFLDGPFAALFADPQWGANWSGASDQNIKSRISSTEMIETSTNANEEPFRKMMSALAMVSDLSNEELKPETFAVVARKASELATESLAGLAQLQGKLGVAEERIAGSNERMSIQVDILQTQINVLEGVDPNEASLRVTALSDQIELAYALTGRLQRLNILDYI